MKEWTKISRQDFGNAIINYIQRTTDQKNHLPFIITGSTIAIPQKIDVLFAKDYVLSESLILADPLFDVNFRFPAKFFFSFFARCGKTAEISGASGGILSGTGQDVFQRKNQRQKNSRFIAGVVGIIMF